MIVLEELLHLNEEKEVINIKNPKNLSGEQQIIPNTMRKKDRVAYSAIGGAILAVSLILLGTSFLMGLKENPPVLLVAIVTGAIGFYLVYSIAYKQK